MLGSSQTVRWPLEQHHQNSAASAVCGLKMVEAGQQCSQDAVFFFLLLLAGAQGHTNMSKMSINAEFRLSAWLLSAEMESTAQLLTQKKGGNCGLYFRDAGCQISEQVVFLRGEKSESISAQSFLCIRST